MYTDSIHAELYGWDFVWSYYSYLFFLQTFIEHVTVFSSCIDNAEFAAGVKQSAKISFEDEAAPARGRTKAIASVEKNNAINLEERIADGTDSNIKIEGKYWSSIMQWRDSF